MKKIGAGILALCICLGLSLAVEAISADDGNGAKPEPRVCSGAYCWGVS